MPKSTLQSALTEEAEKQEKKVKDVIIILF
jgi:hypothetical protein